MVRFWQVLANLLLYGALAYYAVKFTWLDPDPWLAFSVWFLLLVAVLVAATPGLHARRLSPGEYPYED